MWPRLGPVRRRSGMGSSRCSPAGARSDRPTSPTRGDCRTRPARRARATGRVPPPGSNRGHDAAPAADQRGRGGTARARCRAAAAVTPRPATESTDVRSDTSLSSTRHTRDRGLTLRLAPAGDWQPAAAAAWGRADLHRTATATAAATSAANARAMAPDRGPGASCQGGSRTSASAPTSTSPRTSSQPDPPNNALPKNAAAAASASRPAKRGSRARLRQDQDRSLEARRDRAETVGRKRFSL